VHPLQPEDTLQGIIEAVHRFDLILCELSGVGPFTSRPMAVPMSPIAHSVVTRAQFRAGGEPEQRNEIGTSIQAHPCNAATAAGFKVGTPMLEEDGHPRSARCAPGSRTAPQLADQQS
jgi:glycine dehydrogenase subunit 2